MGIALMAGSGSTPEECLTAEELSQIARDIPLGNPTLVVLDNPVKRATFLSLAEEIHRAIALGQMIETPD